MLVLDEGRTVAEQVGAAPEQVLGPGSNKRLRYCPAGLPEQAGELDAELMSSFR
jgi:hypothetical protein